MARSMAPLYDNHDYYKRMFELQEKLRKSEEDRIRLEERFNVLVRESRNRHDACINRMRMRYIQYLEEQRTRDERNHKLLGALDKVMNKLALISAKRDRLNVLRKQYEAYLVRVYANRRPPGSVTGDSGIASQNEDKHTRKTVTTVHPNLASAETRNVSSSRAHSAATVQTSPPRSASTLKFHDQTTVNGVPSSNSPLLSTALPGAPFGVDYHHTNILRAPHVYVTPIAQQSSEQFVHQVPVISAPDTRQYLQTIPGYDGSAPQNLQGIPSVRVGPVLAPMDQIQAGAVPVNRFFREHVELAQATSGLPATARYPAGDATPYAEVSRNETVSPQFNPLFPYHNANILLSGPQSRMREHEPSAIGATSTTAKSSTYRVVSDANRIDSLPGYMDYTLASPQKSEDDGSTHSLTSDDVDDLIRRNERLLWRNAESPSAFDINNANLDENGRTTAILENELDRYISNIRKLHREHGVQSLEELDHEQNTSGDLLNVTLSEDALDLPGEERARKERVPEEMSRILALASDLASRTANLKDAARDSTVKNGSGGSLAEVGNEIRPARQRTNGDAPEEKREAEGRETSARSEIREDVATRSPELERPHGNAAMVKEGWNKTDESRERDRGASTAEQRKDDAKNRATALLRIEQQKSAPRQERLNLLTGKESEIENVFDVAEELPPWDITSVQKRVVELCLDDSNEDPAAETEAEKTADKRNEETANEELQSSADGEAKNARLPQEIDTKWSTGDVSADTTNKNKIDESKIASQADENTSKNDGRNNEMTEPRVDDQRGDIAKDDEYNVEQGGYAEDPSQAQQYGQDPSEQYQYEQNAPYQGAGNEEYATYADQGYAQEGQEYVEYVEGQYEQYPEDPNNQQYQQDPNAQYEQNPSQAYDYNYDPNQEYAGDQQYDPNQRYANDPNNQAYAYTEQVPYDPNQTYDSAYEQEYKEEQCDPEDYVSEEKPETEEALLSQANPELEHKSDGGEGKSQQEDEANLPKKKDVIKSLLDSDTDTTIERNVSNTESDFDFN